MISLCRVAGTNGVIVRCLALDIFQYRSSRCLFSRLVNSERKDTRLAIIKTGEFILVSNLH